jgi:chaperonin cofactor prefoldin
MAHATADIKADSGQEENELSDGLEEVHAAVGEVLNEIDNESDQIEKVVGRAFIGGANREAASELRESIASHIGNACESHQEVSLDEILIALWTELYRASEMATREPGEEDEEAGAEDEPRSNTEDADTAESEKEFGQLFRDEDAALGSEGDSAEEAADPAFQ